MLVELHEVYSCFQKWADYLITAKYPNINLLILIPDYQNNVSGQKSVNFS